MTNVFWFIHVHSFMFMSWTCTVPVHEYLSFFFFFFCQLIFSLHIQPSLSHAVTTLGTMFTEIVFALVIGGLLFFLVQRNRNQVLKTEDGWWGAGVPPDGVEDVTIHPFKVTTSDEELEVRQKSCLFTWDESTVIARRIYNVWDNRNNTNRLIKSDF